MRSHRQCLVAILSVALVSATGSAQSDSSAYTRRPEIRFALLSDGVTRAMAVETNPSFKRSARLNGVEFLARSTNSGGVQLRYLTGDLNGPVSDASSGLLEYVDGRVFIGPRKFAVALGYLGRSQNFNQAKRRFDLARGGVNMTYHFDGAGLGFNFAGSYLRTVTKTKADSLEAEGFEGETGVMYVVPRLPVFVQLGYRRELFRIFRESDTIRRE